MNCDERLQNPEAAFKTQVFHPIVDTAIGQLQNRFEGQRLVSAAFAFLYPQSLIISLLQISDKNLELAANELQQTYSSDLGPNFVAEVPSFRREFSKELEKNKNCIRHTEAHN